MATHPLTICLSCRRFDWQSGSCPEFPDGIPEDIYWHLGDHRVSRAGERTHLLARDGKPVLDAWEAAARVAFTAAADPEALP